MGGKKIWKRRKGLNGKQKKELIKGGSKYSGSKSEKGRRERVEGHSGVQQVQSGPEQKCE